MSPADASDPLALIGRAQDGDRDAIERLFSRYRERVRGAVRLRIGPGLRALEESDDLIQETMLDAFRGLARFEPKSESDLLRWLVTIAVRQIHDRVRHHGRSKRDAGRLEALAADDPERTAPLIAESTGPDRVAQRHEELAQLEHALDALEPELRDLVVWRDYVGMSWDEVARETGRPSPDAARRMHARAIRVLATRLDRDEETRAEF